MNGNYNMNNYNQNNYVPNKNKKSNPVSGIISLLLIGMIIVVGLMAFNVIDNPLDRENKDENVEIIPKEININKGSFYQLEVKSSGVVVYKSSDSKVAEVNEMTGFVIGNSGGTATITAYLKNNTNIKDECIVIVAGKESNVEVSSIELSNSNISLNVGSSKVLTYKVTPENANIKKIYWTTNDSNIATVDKNGLVTGKKVGTATITVRTENGSTSNCEVIVTKQTTPTPTTQYTLTYDTNGGNLNTTSKQINSGEEYGSLPVPIRIGYTFSGWYTAASGGTKVYSNTKITGDTTIYAHWTKEGVEPKDPVVEVYTLVYNANGGSVSPESKKLNKDSVYGELPIPTRSGYTFDGWYSEPSGGTKVSSSTKITGDITIYARWIENVTPITEYTLTFNANGGSVSPTSRTLDKNSVYGSLPTPTRNGYTFNGWYTAASGGTKVSATTIITGNTTIYAQWTKIIQYTLTYNPNGGSVTPTSAKINKGSTYGDLPIPTRSGYTFNGWYTASSGGTKVSSSTKITADTTIYAQWTKKSTPTVQYTLTFNANGGSVSPTTRTLDKDSVYGSLPTPTRSGYTFNGWYTASSGGTKVSSSTKITGNTTIYAQWTIQYTLTYNANGGSVSPTSKKLNNGSTFGDLPIPTRNGYTFNGWYTSASGGTKVSSSTKISANTTIYAQWTRIIPTYTLTYNANGGSVSPTSKSIKEGETYGTLPTPSRTNYTFDGWYTAASGGSKVSASTKITDNTTIYAHWTKIVYTCSLSYNKKKNIFSTDASGIKKITIKGPSGDNALTSSQLTSYHPTVNGKYYAVIEYTDTSKSNCTTSQIDVQRLRILFIGDSITAGSNYGSAVDVWYSWADYIGDTYKFDVRKAGYPAFLISDYGYKDGEMSRWIMWYVWQNMDWPYGGNKGNYASGNITGGYNGDGSSKTQYDYVILHGGINDIASGAPLGTYDINNKSGNYDIKTFLGGLDRYVYLAKQYWPNAKIGYIVNYRTPNHPNTQWDSSFNSKTESYFNKMKEVLSQKWKLPYLDLYNNYSNMLYSYMWDGLHITKDCYKKIGRYIYDWMMNL